MIKEQLQKIDIFKNLTEAELDKIINISIIKKFSRENVLFYQKIFKKTPFSKTGMN